MNAAERKGLATHCTPNPEIEEGVRRLVVIGDVATIATRWAEAACGVARISLSHYRIFPTLLADRWVMMKGQSDPIYGPDLFALIPIHSPSNLQIQCAAGQRTGLETYPAR